MKKIFIIILFEIILIILLHRCLISPHFTLYEIHDIFNINNSVSVLGITEFNHTFNEEELKLIKDILNSTEEFKNIDFVIDNTGGMFVSSYWLKDGYLRFKLYIEKKYYDLLEPYISKPSDTKTIENQKNNVSITIYYPAYDKNRKDYIQLELYTRIPSFYDPDLIFTKNSIQQYIFNLNETKRLNMLDEYYVLVKELLLYFLIFNIFTFWGLRIIKKSKMSINN